MQLNLFNNSEIDWNDIITEWLFNYLNSHYPELNFKFGDKWYYDSREIQEVKCEYKKVICNFHIDRIDLNQFTCWNNSTLIHCGVAKQYGNYEGISFAVNNIQDFEKGVEEIIEKFKEWTEKH